MVNYLLTKNNRWILIYGSMPFFFCHQAFPKSVMKEQLGQMRHCIGAKQWYRYQIGCSGTPFNWRNSSIDLKIGCAIGFHCHYYVKVVIMLEKFFVYGDYVISMPFVSEPETKSVDSGGHTFAYTGRMKLAFRNDCISTILFAVELL
jgi:hypothetical protein